MTKRLFDIFFSTIGLIILSPVFLVVAVLIKLDSKGPVFYRQERVGKDFKDFKIFKFRSMTYDPSAQGPQITVGGDKRVTRAGKIIRKYKIDELPQLINVFKGDMSFVGPRPEVKKYVHLFHEDYNKLLKFRPGITDYASIEYSDEEIILSSADNWEDAYISKVLPEKIRIASKYVDDKNSLLNDLVIILKTIFHIKYKNH